MMVDRRCRSGGVPHRGQTILGRGDTAATEARCTTWLGRCALGATLNQLTSANGADSFSLAQSARRFFMN